MCIRDRSQSTHVSVTPSSIATGPFVHSQSSPTSLLDLLCSPSSSPSSIHADSNETDPRRLHADSNDAGHYLSESEVDSMLSSAYGRSLFTSPSSISDNNWVPRWKIISHLSGSHYFLPMGQCARKYVNILTEEINLLTRGTFPSERVIVFSSVILQRDKIVRSTRDIVRTINRRLDLWSQHKYDLLVQEASRCNQIYQNNCRRRDYCDSDHNERVFTRLMLLGKVRAAMRWLTS